MQIEYQWREGSRISGLSPAMVGSVFEEMEKKRGSVNPQVLVQEARQKYHALHKYFEWNNILAGDKWREEQARQLIGALKVKIIRVRDEEQELEEPISVRVFVPESVAAEEGEGKSKEYRSILSALDNPQRRKRILSQARTELEIWRLRYQAILRLFNAMESAEYLLELLGIKEEEGEEEGQPVAVLVEGVYP